MQQRSCLARRLVATIRLSVQTNNVVCAGKLKGDDEEGEDETEEKEIGGCQVQLVDARKTWSISNVDFAPLAMFP